MIFVGFVLGAACSVAAKQAWDHVSRDNAKEGRRLVTSGIVMASTAAQKVKQTAARLMEDVDDLVNEARAEVDAKAAASAAATPPAEPAATPPAEPSAPPPAAAGTHTEPASPAA